jgi:hypothetical protein
MFCSLPPTSHRNWIPDFWNFTEFTTVFSLNFLSWCKKNPQLRETNLWKLEPANCLMHLQYSHLEQP